MRVSHYSFFYLKCTLELSIFLFLDVNQLTIERMDSFSLLQVIKRVSELEFKYIGFLGFYPFDTYKLRDLKCTKKLIV